MKSDLKKRTRDSGKYGVGLVFGKKKKKKEKKEEDLN